MMGEATVAFGFVFSMINLKQSVNLNPRNLNGTRAVQARHVSRRLADCLLPGFEGGA